MGKETAAHDLVPPRGSEKKGFTTIGESQGIMTTPQKWERTGRWNRPTGGCFRSRNGSFKKEAGQCLVVQRKNLGKQKTIEERPGTSKAKSG